jgi:hypothetical protein
MKRLFEKLKLMFARQPRLQQPVVSGSASNVGNENEYWDAMMADYNTQITCTKTGKVIKERGVSIRRT